MAAGITNKGKDIITGILDNSTWYIALGIGTTAYAATQEALVSEITDSGLARAAATASRITTTVANDTMRLTKTWTATGAKTVAEASVQDTAVSGGLMLGRDCMASTFVVAIGDSFTSTIDVVFA